MARIAQYNLCYQNHNNLYCNKSLTMLSDNACFFLPYHTNVRCSQICVLFLSHRLYVVSRVDNKRDIINSWWYCITVTCYAASMSAATKLLHNINEVDR